MEPTASLAFQEDVRARATVAIAAAKRALARGWGLPLEEALAIEQGEFQDLFASDDAVEGVTAFIEKRKASCRGR